MSTISKPLKAALLASVALGAGAMLYNRSTGLDPVPGPSFPLSFVDAGQTTTATTWSAPPVTRDPFARPDGQIVDQPPEFDSATNTSVDGATAGAEVVDQAPTTVPARITTTVDQRSIAEVFESRLPSTTSPVETSTNP